MVSASPAVAVVTAPGLKIERDWPLQVVCGHILCAGIQISPCFSFHRRQGWCQWCLFSVSLVSLSLGIDSSVKPLQQSVDRAGVAGSAVTLPLPKGCSGAGANQCTVVLVWAYKRVWQ